MSATVAEAYLPAADRGSLRIADRVVSKIASQSAREVLTGAPGAEHVPRGAPQAAVAVRRQAARVRLSVELGYPTDIGAICRTVRLHVTDRVQALTGMAVPEVTVEVERLHSPAMYRGEEGRVR